MSASSSSSSSYAATAASASAGAGVSNQPAEHESVSVDSAGGPWEWPSFAMWIRQMEESMLCPICGRFIEAAVTIRQCGHVFCSECIRRHRAHDEDQVCPACRGGHRTGIDIVATPSINRMIDSWLSTRQVILMLTNKKGSKDFFHKYTQMNEEGKHRHITQESSGSSQRHSRGVKYMVEPVYHMLKEKDLRTKLRQCCLPPGNTQEECIRRHREFIILYNSQIDAGKEPSSAEVAKRVIQKEREKQFDKKATKNLPTQADNCNRLGNKNNQNTGPDDPFVRLALEARERLLARGDKLPKALQTKRELGKRNLQKSKTKPGKNIAFTKFKPPVWRCVWSEKAERYFYYNTETRMGQWMKPDDYDGDYEHKKKFTDRGIQTENSRCRSEATVHLTQDGKAIESNARQKRNSVVTIDMEHEEATSGKNEYSSANGTIEIHEADSQNGTLSRTNQSVGVKREISQSDSWHCESCTYLHEGKDSKEKFCIMCQKPRPLSESEKKRHRRARRATMLTDYKGLG